MKIAFLNMYQSSVNRGMETFVYELSNRLKMKNDVDIFTNNDVVRIDWSKKDSTGTLLRRFFLDYWSLKICQFTLNSLPKLYKNKYDFIIPINGGWQSLIIKIYTIFVRSKMLIVGQSGIGWDDRINIFSFPDAFVALSTKALTWSKRINPFIKSVYIPNGVDLDKFKPRRPNLQGRVILCVGALTEQKRIHLVIKAVAKIPGVNLIVIGDGDLRTKIQELGDDLLGDRFQLSKVKFDEMPKMYQKAKVFTLVSKSSEAFGNVFVEAMASGLAVVATDDPIRREIIGNAGFFVDPANVDEYAKALKKALDTNWKDIPRKQAEKFSWDKIAIDYEKLFNTL